MMTLTERVQEALGLLAESEAAITAELDQERDEGRAFELAGRLVELLTHRRRLLAMSDRDRFTYAVGGQSERVQRRAELAAGVIAGGITEPQRSLS